LIASEKGKQSRRHVTALAILVLLAGCGPSAPATARFELDEAPVLPADPPLLAIACVGDTHGRNQLEEFGDVDPLAGVAHLFGLQDLFLFNHEGVLVDALPPSDACPYPSTEGLLVSLPSLADDFRLAPVTVATLANNHILDCGGNGLEETILALEDRGILTLGAGRNLQEACAPVEVTVNGVECAFLNYLAMSVGHAGIATPGPADWNACDGAGQVAAFKAAGKFVVVALHLHLGRSWTEVTSSENLAAAEAALDAGADLVVGHGSHVPQGILLRNGGVAFLSLGNFLFNLDIQLSTAAHRSLLANVAVHPDELVVSLRALRLDTGGRPWPTDPADELEILMDVARLSAGFGTDLRIWQGVGYLVLDRRQ
jgi:poly-gamma-glutamate synthesis protein (capsule biosynthesis protein)